VSSGEDGSAARDAGSAGRHRIDVEADEPVRLDKFLVESELELSRSQLKKLIDAGDVLVNGQRPKAGRKLRAGDVVDVVVPEAVEPAAEPEDIALEVLFEDDHLIVVNKPAGMVVHPAPGHPRGTLVNALMFHCVGLSGVGGSDGVLRPGIVHRLDRLTSGVMVACKDDAAHRGLADLFARKDLRREYLALTAPAPRDLTGTFDTLYGRHPVQRKKFSSKVSRGKRAVTHYRTERRFGDRAALLRCTLETGRTHQIRVHCADGGAPVLGDPVYARKPRDPELAELAADLGRQALHAAVLGFVHPVTGADVLCETDLPADMAAAVAALAGGSGSGE